MDKIDDQIEKWLAERCVFLPAAWDSLANLYFDFRVWQTKQTDCAKMTKIKFRDQLATRFHRTRPSQFVGIGIAEYPRWT